MAMEKNWIIAIQRSYILFLWKSVALFLQEDQTVYNQFLIQIPFSFLPKMK